MLTWTFPWAFVLLPLPLIVYFLVPPQKNELRSVYAPSLMMLAESQHSEESKPNLVIIALMALIWLGLITAAAGPTQIGEGVSLPNTDRNMMLAVDLSGSMRQEDMAYQGRLVNRLQAVKAVISDFVSEREGDRMGLILFGDKAYIQTPLTFDLATLKQQMDEAFISMAGKQTAIGDAIGLGVKRLQQLPESNRVLILLTDGQNTAGEIDPLQAAELAAEAGVKIYTIGIGADELVVQGFFGPRRMNPSQDLDERSLMAIAERTEGQYFRARDLNELASIYQKLDSIEPIEIEERIIRPEKALFYWPLGISVCLALVLWMTSLSALQPLLPSSGRQRGES